MSTPNPTHIIAEHRAQLVHAHAHSLISVGSTMNLECSCGGFATAGPYSVDEMYAFHAEHVVSKLTDAGYSIMKSAVFGNEVRPVCSCGHLSTWHTSLSGPCNDWVEDGSDCTCRSFLRAAAEVKPWN